MLQNITPEPNVIPSLIGIIMRNIDGLRPLTDFLDNLKQLVILIFAENNVMS